jgi:hypothetical protein
MGASVEGLVGDKRLFKAFLNHTAYDPFEASTESISSSSSSISRRDTLESSEHRALFLSSPAGLSGASLSVYQWIAWRVCA